MASERERPSRHGAILGEFLSAVEIAGRACTDTPREMCATCAFRPGTMTNQMAATGLQAFNIVMGADSDQFACHHGMVDGWPTKLCAGYLTAINAPWETIQAEGAKLAERMNAAAGPDEIRAAFDAWIAEVDPAGTMDDYQRARAYLRRSPPPHTKQEGASL